ncbi:MAG: hypothetical protein RI967_328 [Planctomycetota bacterium]
MRVALFALTLLGVANRAAPGTPEPPAPPRDDATRTVATDAPAATDAATPLRIAVIGASASAGFGCVLRERRDDGEWSASFDLAEMLKLACPDDAIVTSDLATGNFFLAPLRIGANAVERAVRFRADCVVALDFLFWFVYGVEGPDGKLVEREEDRLAKLERGLEMLASIDAPLLLGDLPDMRAAQGRMLGARQVPAPETLEAANARLAAWASTRPNVRLVPLAAMQRDLASGEGLEIAGARLRPTKESPLLQRDALHPAPLGLAGLACDLRPRIDEACGIDGDCPPDPVATFERARMTLRRPRSGARDERDESAPERPEGAAP